MVQAGGGPEVAPVPIVVPNGTQRQRASLRGAIMRAVNGVADDQVLDGLTLEQTSTQIRHLEQSWARWQELHHLMMGMEGNDAAAEAAERIHVEVEQQVLASVARLEAQLRRRRDEHAPAAVAVPVPVAQAVIVRHHREPRIGQFDGKHENWASFFDLFRVEVDGREDMDPLEKLVYLKAAWTRSKSVGRLANDGG